VLAVHARVPRRGCELPNGVNAEERLCPIGEVERTALQVPLVDAFHRRRGGDGVALLGLLQGGDVAGRADHAIDLSVRPAQTDAMLARPMPAAVEGTIAVVALVARALAFEVVDES